MIEQYRQLGVPRCRVCRGLILPWQRWQHIEVSADSTEPPVIFAEAFHALCMTVVEEKVRNNGGVIRRQP